MLRSYILCLFIITSVITAYAQENLLESANKLYNDQSYQQAYLLYQDLIKKDSTDQTVLLKLGITAQRIGDLKSAKAHLLQLEKQDTIDQNYLKPLASIYEVEDNVPKSIKYYLKLSKKYPDNFLYYRKLGQLYLKAGETGESFTYLAKSYKLNDKDFFTIKGLSDILIANKNFELADSVLTEAIAYDQENYNLQLIYAGSKYRQRQFDTTAMVLHKIRGRIDFSNYYNKMMGYSLIQIDSFEKAIYYLRKSLVDESNPEANHYYLATAYEKMEDFEYASHHYQEAINTGISANIRLYHSNLAKLMDDKGDKRAAIKNYEAAYRYSDDPVYLFYLGRLTDDYYKDKSVAIRYYDRYAQSKHANVEYKRYAVDRKRYLREQQHFSSKK